MSTLKSSAEDLTLNADGSGNDIKFQSNGVEKASIDQDGSIFAGSKVRLIDDTSSKVEFGDSGNASIGKIEYTHSGDYLYFKVNDAERLRITSGGDLDVKTGDIVFNTAGKGICLGVTSNTDANTLDDYEEGTWTPALRGGTTAGSPTYHGQVGHYTKIGRVVTIMGNIHNSNLVDLDGVVYIIGLPFTTHGYDSTISFGYAGSMGITAGESITGNTVLSSTKFRLLVWNSTGGTGYLDDAEFTNGCHLVFSGTYHTP